MRSPPPPHEKGVSLLTNPFQHDLVISFEKDKVTKSQIHEISLNVKNEKYRDIAISCGAKIKSQSPRKSPPLLGASSSSSSSAAPVSSGSSSRDRRDKDEKRRKDKRKDKEDDGSKQKEKKKKRKEEREKPRKEKRDKSDKVNLS